MKRISSNFTLFLKVFLPTFWFVFFGLVGIAIVITGSEGNPLFSKWGFQLMYLAFFVGFGVLFYLTFLQLKRVDFDDTGFYVSNYFRTYKYSFSSIEDLRENDYLIFKTVNIILSNAGNFGKILRFIPEKSGYAEFKSQIQDKKPTTLD